MEALRVNVFLGAMVVALMMAAQFVSAQVVDAPAPSPTADAAAFVPAVFASVAALAFGMFF